MQVAARLLRSRLSPSIVSACGASHVSCPILRVPVLGNHVVGSSEPCLHRVFSSTNFYRHAHWGPLKQLQPTIRALGRRQHTETIVGLTIATSYLSRSQGFSKAILCERDQQARVTSYSPKENFLDLEERQDSLVQWLKRLWVPALVVMTVAMGYQYPVSLFVNLIFLLWSTKPTPASIYIWVEQRRLRQASERRSFDRLKEKSAELLFLLPVHVS